MSISYRFKVYKYNGIPISPHYKRPLQIVDTVNGEGFSWFYISGYQGADWLGGIKESRPEWELIYECDSLDEGKQYCLENYFEYFL